MGLFAITAVCRDLQKSRAFAAIGGFTVAIATSGAFAQAPSFQGIGDLPGGTVQSEAYAISADGTTVVGVSESTNGREAAQWRAGTLMGLGDLPGAGFDSHASAVSADGSVIVGLGLSASGYRRAVVWNTGVIAELPQLPGLLGHANARHVSPDGTVVFGDNSDDFGSINAFRYEGGTITALADYPGLPNDCAGGVFGCSSRDGSIVPGRVRLGSGAYRACFWTGTVLTLLNELPGPGPGSGAYGVSYNGQVLVGLSRSSVSSSDGEACRWVSGVPLGLGHLPGGSYDGEAFTATVDGSVVIGRSNVGSSTAAFIWDQTNGMRDLKAVLVNDFGLDLTGWTLRAAFGMTPDGAVIVGRGINPDGNTEGWIATVPCWVAPYVGDQPSNATVCSQGAATLSVTTIGAASSTYQWQRETSPSSNTFLDLADGPTSSWDGNLPGYGAVVSGTTTDTLTFAADLASGNWLGEAHAIRYRCIVSNACGSATSDAAQLTVCIADYNCDGFVDGIDSDTFNNNFESTDPQQQMSADINRDGFVDGIDYDEFNNAFEAGC